MFIYPSLLLLRVQPPHASQKAKLTRSELLWLVLLLLVLQLLSTASLEASQQQGNRSCCCCCCCCYATPAAAAGIAFVDYLLSELAAAEDFFGIGPPLLLRQWSCLCCMQYTPHGCAEAKETEFLLHAKKGVEGEKIAPDTCVFSSGVYTPEKAKLIIILFQRTTPECMQLH